MQVAKNPQQIGGVIFVIGHRHPDTDSIVSAIAYARYKQLQGLNVVACRCGDINPETKYLLERFRQPEPLLLLDARAQMDETEMDDPNSIGPQTILRDLLDRAPDGIKAYSVVDEKRRLLGMVTNSNIGDILWGDTAKAIEMIAKTSIENIARSIDGKILYAPVTTRHNGKISIVAISANRLERYDLQDRLVVLGNDTHAQLDAIQRGAAILVLVWTKQVAPQVLELAKEKKCAVILSGNGAMNTSRYLYYSIPVEMIMSRDLVAFNEAEFVEDVQEKMIRSRYRQYPVVDSENRVMGFSSRYRVLNASRRRFILVDHNESSQAISGIEKADILEIIDHHRLGDLTSDRPISFRNEPVGATATIVSKIYFESGLEPEKEIAGLLLSAIVSDTLNFRSPTTSAVDLEIADRLRSITGLDTDELAKEIFTLSSQRTMEDLDALLNGDVKEFDIAGGKVIISQQILYRLNTVEEINEEALRKKMAEEARRRGADLWVMVFTTARDNGSVFYAAGKGAKVFEEIFPNAPGEKTTFHKGIVSRKNQIVPQISLYFRNGGGWR